MINIHRYEVVENEHLYGPGKRLLLFTQGCSLRCKGCINQHLWEFGKGIDVTVDAIVNQCHNLDGITLHGGEPLDQANVLGELINKIKQRGKTVILFTGYAFKELNTVQKQAWIASDIVISGRYEEKKRNIYLQFRGSTNQKVFTHKGKYKDYKIKDGQTIAVLSFNAQGEMQSLGFRTDELDQLLNEISREKNERY